MIPSILEFQAVVPLTAQEFITSSIILNKTQERNVAVLGLVCRYLITIKFMPRYLGVEKYITEVNLSAFVYRLCHEDFSPIFVLKSRKRSLLAYDEI